MIDCAKAPQPDRAQRWWQPSAPWMPVVSALVGIGMAALCWRVTPAGWQAVKSHPYFAVREIGIDGNLRLPREEVLQWAGLREGMSIWDAAPVALRLRLQKNPWIERVTAQRDFPSRISIRLQERRPVALAQLDELQYIDRRGRVLGPLRDDDSRDFVIITGVREAGDFLHVGLNRALTLLRFCERVDCALAISEVHVDRQRGLTLFPMHTTVSVTLGWGRWREKLAQSARVLTAWQGQLERLAVVDVSFRDLVVVRLRDEERPVAPPAKRGVRV
jgi:cell division protein FtsQ